MEIQKGVIEFYGPILRCDIVDFLPYNESLQIPGVTAFPCKDGGVGPMKVF